MPVRNHNPQLLSESRRIKFPLWSEFHMRARRAVDKRKIDDWVARTKVEVLRQIIQFLRVGSCASCNIRLKVSPVATNCPLLSEARSYLYTCAAKGCCQLLVQTRRISSEDAC